MAMVMPPNGLTNELLGRTPEEMVQFLDEEGCLSLKGRTNTEEVLNLINATIEEDARLRKEEPDLMGPSVTDRIGKALVDSPYLGRKGTYLYNSPA